MQMRDPLPSVGESSDAVYESQRPSSMRPRRRGRGSEFERMLKMRTPGEKSYSPSGKRVSTGIGTPRAAVVE